MASAVENICWVLTEGAAGMENQALGLAERVGLPITVKRANLRFPWRWLAPRLPVSPFGRAEAGSSAMEPPWPRLVIGCGRQSIPFVRAIKRASGGRTLTVQCQHPRIDPAHFDLVIPPEHDRLTGPNVFPILGSANRITSQRLAEARQQFATRFEPLRTPRLGALVGGSSSSYSFGAAEAQRLAGALANLAKSQGLMLTTSRRTGPEAAAKIANALAASDADLFLGEGENPYLGILAWADAFLVTADSVNLACEAAAIGKPVHIFPLPGGSAKFRRFHLGLERRGIARTFDGHIEQWTYPPLDETGRAAARIQALLDEQAAASDITGRGLEPRVAG
ncbi:MAG TPA: mitochondrial fission ELM1 family protein [Rhizomicrobium sp.]|jgi:mitochondrial fission protein ELM1